MSTYTDLHNRIKENLTILRKPGSKDDGMSPQKVILINPENQFYGTFNGKMNITSGILSGLKIIDSELEGVKLDNASVDGVSLGELKTTVDVNTQDIEQLQKDAKAISAAHDALSVGLSGTVDNLSVAVNEKLDNAVEEVKKSISGVVGDVTTLSIGLGDLSSKIETLSSGMLNGVVYRGQLVLHRDYYTRPRQLFNDDPACCLLEGTQAPLKNGWMWRVYLDRENVSGDYVHVSDPNTGRELDLGKGDYIIIKNHLTSLYEVVPDNQMRMDDFDVINAQDEDDTKIVVLKQVSAYLDSKIDESLVSAKDYTDEVSAGLSTLFDGKLSSVSAYALAESIKYTNGISSEICSTVKTELTALSNDLLDEVNAKYVHKSGDTIAKLSVEGQLSVAGKTTINHDFGEAGGTKLELSKDKVELKTFAPITISSTSDSTIAGHDIELSVHNLSINLEDADDDLFINGESLKSKLDKKLGVDLAKELSSKLALSDDISWELSDYNNSAKFLLSDDLEFEYDKNSNKLRLTVQGNQLDISVADLFKGRIVNKVWVSEEDGIKYLNIEFQVGDEHDPEKVDLIKIVINDLFDPYTSGNGISVDNNLCIHIADYFYNQVQAIQGYVDELSGPQGPKVGIISSLSAAIEAIDLAQTQELYFAGMIELDTADTSKHYPTVGHFLSVEVGGQDAPSQVRNNSYFTVKFFNGLSSSEIIVTDDGLSVGDGDQIIIHEHNPLEGEEVKFISWGDLKLIDSDAAGNVYLIKAGVSRYEFEAEAKKREDDDNYISSWIKKNFANTGAGDELSTTILNYDVSATKELLVASNAYMLSDLSVAGSLFVNGAQLGITVKPVDPDVPGGETETVARTVADKVEFTTSSADNAPTININNRYITLSKAAVNVDATSSFTLSADQTKVIDATSSQVEILSVLTVSSDQARITTLSSGVLSSDTLTSRIADISEKLSATSAYIDQLSADKATITTLSARVLSSDALTARVVDVYEKLNATSSYNNYLSASQIDADEVIADFGNVKDRQSMSSITDLCSALSTSIGSLEDYVASCDAVMSAAIDNKIFIDGVSAETLSAVHIGQQDYYNLVSSDLALSNVLYVVSSENINAYGQQIKNLAMPELSDDAATKGYVDGIFSSLNSQIQQLSDDLSSEIETLSTNLSTSISSLTSQMELALSALDEDPLSSLNENSKISTVISAVLDIRDTLKVLKSILRI